MPASSPEDLRWLEYAIELSRNCSNTARYFVGSVVVDAGGQKVGEGYTGETEPSVHAEELAIQRAVDIGAMLEGATLYSSLEPCGKRKSSPATCVDLIVASPIKRVAYALDEPPILAPGNGAELLVGKGIDVQRIDALAQTVREINSHLIE